MSTPPILKFGLLVLVLFGLLRRVDGAESTTVTAPTDAPRDFRHGVMAVLSKAGCNAGKCHGNSQGRGGFKLSLRGQQPDWDYQVLTRDLRSRRINRAVPDRSLLLLKATAQVPHEGGRRIVEDSLEYGILLDWVARGLPRVEQSNALARIEIEPADALVLDPQSAVQLTVTAQFDDGSRHDITELAIYEPAQLTVSADARGRITAQEIGQATVVVRYLEQQAAMRVAFLPDDTAFQSAASAPDNPIDVAVAAQLERLHIRPAPPVSDGVFVRRIHLDLTGQLPRGDVARAFVADTRVDKRARLIDRLIASPQFADRWALYWSDLLRVEEKTMDARGVELFHGWIREAMAGDMPLDQFAREILTATGSTYTAPPANFYRALRAPDVRAEAVAQVFLGTRLQCAKCHNHPFEKWTQDDYHEFAALFAPIDYEIIENKRRDKFDKNQFIGEQVVKLNAEAKLNNPRTGTSATPRFLGDPTPCHEAVDGQLDAFAQWLTAPDHPLFAPVLANRIWSMLMGHGLVEPVDDFRLTNPPDNPELLKALVADLRYHDYRLRPLVRLIVNSQAYQRSSLNPAEADDARAIRHFGQAAVRRLTAEEMIDAVSQLTGVPTGFDGYELGVRAGQLPGVNKEYRRDAPVGGARFLQLFGKPERLLTCACERSNETTLGQVFELTGGELIHQKIAAPDNRLTELVTEATPTSEIIQQLTWEALGRAPSTEEREQLSAHVDQAADRRMAVEDVMWALLNSKEFLHRR